MAADSLITNQAGIKRVQYNLLMLGYKVTLSGQLDAATSEALQDFQRKNNLVPSGKANQKTFYQLEKVVSFKRHQVKKGETLTEIANKYQVQVRAIKVLNNKDTANIKAGEELIIPRSNTGSLDKYRLNKIINYRIQPGDQLPEIAKKFNTTVKQLKKINHITYKNITKIKVLRIPIRITKSRIEHENLTQQEILNQLTAPAVLEVTSEFGYRNHPIDNRRKLHKGIDLGVARGSKIKATYQGQVLYAGWVQGYGRTLTIDHGSGIVSLYGHNSQLKVDKGEEVSTGELIAISGSTGKSTGPHLHFGVYVNDKPVDPLKYVR